MKKILFITPYPYDTAGSQRFRFELFLSELKKRNIKYKQIPFVDKATFSIMYTPGNYFLKFFGIIKGILRRFYCLLITPFYDYVFIHREAAPIGPPFFEWVIAKVLRKPYIYDFDDAIWLHDISESNKGVVQKLKSSPNKIGQIIKYANKVSAGNDYLANYAKKNNVNTSVLPTIVDINYHKKKTVKKKYPEKTCIGWTGTHTTLRHFEAIVPILEKLYKTYKDKIYFKLIVNQNIEYPSLDLKSTIWNKESEIEQLSELDIGIMPLPNNKWANGKCGFKAIQYMALEIPCIASNVGVNSKIIDHQENGILTDTFDEFYSALEDLILSSEIRINLGINARKKIAHHFSIDSNASSFFSFFSSF